MSIAGLWDVIVCVYSVCVCVWKRKGSGGGSVWKLGFKNFTARMRWKRVETPSRAFMKVPSQFT